MCSVGHSKLAAWSWGAEVTESSRVGFTVPPVQPSARTPFLADTRILSQIPLHALIIPSFHTT
jgi:hypothetical protein